MFEIADIVVGIVLPAGAIEGFQEAFALDACHWIAQTLGKPDVILKYEITEIPVVGKQAELDRSARIILENAPEWVAEAWAKSRTAPKVPQTLLRYALEVHVMANVWGHSVPLAMTHRAPEPKSD